jgi:hypothetical protein
VVLQLSPEAAAAAPLAVAERRFTGMDAPNRRIHLEKPEELVSA